MIIKIFNRFKTIYIINIRINETNNRPKLKPEILTKNQINHLVI